VQVLRRRAHDERGRVDDLLGDEARVGVGALAHRVAAHVLHAAGDDDVVRAERDAGRRRRHRGHRAGAHPVDREARHGAGEAGEERGGAADREALVAGLGRRGDRDVVHPVRRQLGVPAQQFADAGDDEVVGAGLGVEALLTRLAERGPNAVDEDDVAEGAGHGSSWGRGSPSPCGVGRSRHYLPVAERP
jgi:hypothetical protein